MKKTAVLAFVLISLMVTCIILDKPVLVRAQENVTTSASITVWPNPVEVGNSVVINVQIDPPPPLPTDRINNINITYISPDEVAITGPYNTSYTPTLPGNWTLKLSFLGEAFANGTTYYLPSENQTTLTVLPHPSPATVGFWTQKAPMPTARWGLGVAVVDGKIYAIGGTNNAGIAAIGTNEMYDPTTDTWTTEAPMPTPRSGFATAVYQDKIYCIGGDNASGTTGINQAYNPKTDTWETKESMPTPQDWIAGNLVNGKIYIISGGLNQVYDPANDSWTTKTPPPTPTIYSTSAVVDDKIYIIGGSNSGGGNSGNYAVNLTQIYDPQTDTWSKGASIPQNYPSAVGTGTAQATTGMLAPKQIVVIGGGYDLFQYPLVACPPQSYFPKNDSWTRGVAMPTSRERVGVAVINDAFYVIGGGHPNANNPSNANEQYTPPGYGTTDPTYQSPSPTPSTSPSPTQTTTPSPTISPTTQPTPTNSPIPTETQQPTPSNSASTADNNSSLQANAVWIAAAVVVIGLITIAVIFKRKNQKSQEYKAT